MAENDTKETVAPDPSVQVAKDASDLAQKAFAEMNVLKGQLSVLAAAATAGQDPVKVDEPAPDIVTDTDKSFDHHLNKRTQPHLTEQYRREAVRERDIIALKNPDDWKEFGPAVERMIKENGISNETLAQPGAHEKLLNLVKGEHIEEIVKRKTEQALAAKAMESLPGKKDVTPAAPKYEMHERQKFVARKLGISEADWTKTAESTTVGEDGWITGATV